MDQEDREAWRLLFEKVAEREKAAPRLSAFVITCDRPQRDLLLRACLKRARFVDQLVLIDKSRSNHGAVLAIADEFNVDICLRAEWTAVVEDTRALAQDLCDGDRIMRLDDDEILCSSAANVIRNRLETDSQTLVYQIPTRNHILGRYNQRASPAEWRPALYRRGAVSYYPVVHAGTFLNCTETQIAVLDEIWIDHLSHANVEQFVEKTNRYTSQQFRTGVNWRGDESLVAVAQEIISGLIPYPDTHVEAVTLLRDGIYPLVDLLKRWQATQPDGDAAFAEFCRQVLAD